jgi:hypothetical protein
MNPTSAECGVRSAECRRGAGRASGIDPRPANEVGQPIKLEPFAQAPVPQSSVRSAIFIVQGHRGGQAPSGAAWQPRTVRRADMPLLTELETRVLGPRSYKYGAPDGAVTHVPRCKRAGLEPVPKARRTVAFVAGFVLAFVAAFVAAFVELAIFRQSRRRRLGQRSVDKVVFWSAPAERSGDGAFGRPRRPRMPDAARAKAAPRSACHRTPDWPVRHGSTNFVTSPGMRPPTPHSALRTRHSPLDTRHSP